MGVPWINQQSQRFKAAIRRYSEHAIYVQAQRVIVFSRIFGDLAVEAFGLQEDLIRVVPGHIDLDRFAPRAWSKTEARSMLDLPAGRPVLLIARRLKRRMGLEKFIDALAVVARH